MKNSIIIFALFFTAINSFAQETNYGEVPLPADRQTEAIVLLGGIAHLGNGQIIENSAIGFRDGKITFVADATTVKLNPADAKIINIAGKHVYPGLIAPNTVLGLNEIDAARPTRDQAEVGEFNPNVRSIIAYNTDSRVTPTIRSNGILLVQITPQGGTITGSSSIVELDAWNWEDASYKLDNGIHLNWPNMFSYSGWWAEPGGVTENKDYTKQVDNITNFFNEAKAYSQTADPEVTNLKFEAMKGLFDGSKKLFINVDYVRSIEAAIDFAKSFGLQIVIVGGSDSWMVADLLKENNVAVILGETHDLPGSEDDDINQPYKTPYMLQQKGILYCLSINGAWQQRNLPFMAGTAAAYGLSKEEALMAISSSTAKILGIENSVGTIESGKDATLIVSDGDILDMRTSKVIYAFIEGRQIDLDNKQKQLYRRFMAKYGLTPVE